MTTIAYDLTSIAVDSRETCGGVIASDSVLKIHRSGDLVFVLAGQTAHIHNLVADWSPGGKTDIPDDGANGFVVNGGEVFMVGICDGVFMQSPCPYKWAVGSGGDFALAVMDMGATAVGAVRKAAKRDLNTGGPIREYIIASGEVKHHE